jgi:hypothetical protein
VRLPYQKGYLSQDAFIWIIAWKIKSSGGFPGHRLMLSGMKPIYFYLILFYTKLLILCHNKKSLINYLSGMLPLSAKGRKHGQSEAAKPVRRDKKDGCRAGNMVNPKRPNRFAEIKRTDAGQESSESVQNLCLDSHRKTHQGGEGHRGVGRPSGYFNCNFMRIQKSF